MTAYNIALVGNPNVGKSTVFNALTGMHQHTGNWPGKTVSSAEGSFRTSSALFRIIDLPGTYSLTAHSPEEAVTADFLQSEHPDAVIAVCDSSAMERGIALVLQILSLTTRVVLCANLADEAEKRGISLDTKTMSELLGIPVISTSARSKKGLRELTDAVYAVCKNPPQSVLLPHYPQKVWESVHTLMQQDVTLTKSKVIRMLASQAEFSEAIAAAPIALAARVCKLTVKQQSDKPNPTDYRLDRIFTGKKTGIPCMLLLLLLLLWLTIVGANGISDLLSGWLFSWETPLANGLTALHAPLWLTELLTQGVYRVLAWVVSVMLPPMAIFFPLFTLLEDFGYLPRVAFNLDGMFRKAKTCGKQALTVCMGFGCNAVGITGCRIIDSPRERDIAMLTNVFTPCNGRFPFLISVFTLFFLSGADGFSAGFYSALGLTAIILLGIFMTFLTSRLLSATLFRGKREPFTLELPPYRKPQIGKVIVRSVFDRTLFVLGRAAICAIPAGAVLWICANLSLGDKTLLCCITDTLDPFGKILGMDGVILTAFLLGFPANEIVMPIIIMAYTASGSLAAVSGASLGALLTANGWTPITALCVLLFSLMHFPCATACYTLYKESGSLKKTLLGIVLPTLCGMGCCLLVNGVGYLLGIG